LPGHPAALGARLPGRRLRRLVGLPPADDRADPGLLRLPAAAGQPGRGVQPAAAARQEEADEEGGGAPRRRGEGPRRAGRSRGRAPRPGHGRRERMTPTPAPQTGATTGGSTGVLARARNIRCVYGGGEQDFTAVHDVSLELKEGEI